MDQNTIKISSVLSDPTRFSIYQFISKQRGDVTVREIAKQFDIHPNVARLHLTRLIDVQMISSETKKTGKGGRPSRFYRLSNEVIQLQFPYRDYERLAKMALESLMSFGDEGSEALKKIGFTYGKDSAEAYIRQHQVDMPSVSIEEKIKMIEQIAIDQGLDPEIHYFKEKDTIEFKIYNCTFKELMSDQTFPLCTMHHQLFNGIFLCFFGDHMIIENPKLDDSTAHVCSYTVIQLSNK